MSGSKNILSIDQKFQLYLGGKLSKKEIADLEKELTNNPFYKDAFEGYQAYPESITSLNKLMINKEQFITNSFVIRFYSIFIIVSLLLLSSIVYKLNNSIPTTLIDVAEVVPKFKVETSKKVITSKPVQELSDIIIDESILKEEKNQVLYKGNTEGKLDTKMDSLIKPTTEILNQEILKIKQKPMVELGKEYEQKLEITSVPIISLHGLNSVNYSKIEGIFQFKKTVVVLSGLPANIEGEEVRKSEPSHELKTEYISYNQYLGNIQSSFRKNKFKKALKGYKEILKQYPNDINAHFYSAICYYNINQPLKAIEHLDIVINHQYDTFRQEGEWYKAQSLYDLKREDEAIVILDKIIRNNNFYAIQAKSFKSQIMKQ